MNNAAEELDRVAVLCAQLDLGVAENDVARCVLEPMAGLIGAETASLRRFGVANGTAMALSVVDIAVPRSVREAYLDRYFELDPVRSLLARRFAGPLFDDPARVGEWTANNAAPVARARLREEFRRYREEFLLPNHFFHHLGFCVQDSDGGTVAIDFHRRSRSAEFGALERARARLVAGFLHAKAGAGRSGAPRSTHVEPGLALTNREMEVAEAVAIGLSNKQVAENLDISVRTVENHLRSIFSKCNVPTRTRLAAKLRGSSGSLRP